MKAHCRSLLLTLLFPLTAGCSDDDDPAPSIVDTGVLPVDSGADSGGQLDAEVFADVVEPDTGVVVDTGFADASPMDAEPMDAMADSGVDAGMRMPAPTIDGDLSDWTSPDVTLTNPGFGGSGLFGPDNRFEELLVFADATFLYLGYRYRASGNSALVHLDTVAGGETTPAMFDAWPRLVTFNNGIDHFIAQFEGQDVQFRDAASATMAPENGAATFSASTAGSAPAYVTEVAIPWSAIGLSATSSKTFTLYGGIYGGDGFGAGDIIPNADSTPAVVGNTVDTNDSFRVTYANGLSVTVTP